MWNEDIKNITSDQFELLKKTGKRSEEINGIKSKELIYMPYVFVKERLPELFTDADFKGLFLLLFEKLNLNTIQTKDAISFLLYLVDSWDKIIQVEKEYLTSIPDADMMSAGVNRLNELGELNVYDAVAQRFGYKIEEIKKMPYHEVFNLQRKMKLESDIQKDMNRIQKSKAKKNY